ncbi:MAG: DUF4838 domain-containing protein [Bacteroidia bacterium]|nr:MAG: DUF4838 domain-containing protein [Bacteroidia bacterium]
MATLHQRPSRFFALLLYLGIFISLMSCFRSPKVIVRDGVSSYEIVIPSEADSTILHAAEELRHYILQSSGADIPVTTEETHDPEAKSIKVGFEPTTAYTPYTIGYYQEGDDLYICGGSPQSTLYAVYRFLEQELGCMWLSPEAELIPKTKHIRIEPGTSYTYAPEIETRTVHSRLFYENHVFADKLGVTYEAFPGYVPGAGVHTFHRFLPEASFYEAHPEYYALHGDKRLTTQLCLSNEDVLRIVIDSVRALFERYPDAEIISVSQDDNTQYCMCEHCSAIDSQEGSPSGSMIRFVNAVAEQVPGKMISTLAYQYTRKPCITRPAANVLITLCSIECDRSKAIEEGCSDFANDLQGWKQLTDKIRIWDYTTQFTNFLAPFPNLHTLHPNIQLFRNSHAKWIFEQHSHQPSELFELRSYLTAQLLWNPDQDPDQIMESFSEAYYQEAAPFVLEYIHTIHEEIQKVPGFFLFLYGDPSQGFDSFLRPELLMTYDKLFTQAEDAVSHKPEVLDRVKKARLSTHYAVLEASRKGVSEDYRLSPQIRPRLEQFKSICESAEITMMNEMGYSVDEYIQSYERALDRASLPNKAAKKPVFLLSQPKKYAGEDPQVLTDGSLGGNSFYSNWLGFEGNDMKAIIDLGQAESISHVHTAFLKVTNHVVFFPEQVEISYSTDSVSFHKIAERGTAHPLKSGDKVNDLEYYDFQFTPVQARYIKVYAKSMKTAPAWHHASGLPSWIFCDEVIIN